ncbi:CHAT domain-containing protein [Anabaena sp. UHCC 0187]|uniref:cell division protein HetF n=1 Tax=Anabaena sp. UHCC 0187 TaxID=2590018 RepID=UPI00144665C9|nr:CHAT domain-containing protein [Dolichospermum sp.]MTJ14582.1 CHAT domain-containing protein [Anabaena sp. UHCC 0187]
MTQEFHLSATPVGQNDYLVRTEQVAPGVPLAEELVHWPVAEWLAAAGHLMDDPLQLVLQGDMISRNSVNLVSLGQELYNALFQGTLRDSWITAQGIAQNHQQVLRLRLGLKDTRLARLPWEVMHAGDRPLATGPYITFARYQSGIAPPSRLLSHNLPPSPEARGIKVLMVISSPTDLVRLDLLKQEAINLKAELHRQALRVVDDHHHHLPEIELTVLDGPGREELTQALEQGHYHILHYSGHSNLGANGGQIYLVSKKTGLTETLSGDDLAGLLVNNNIQMAVFNSCLGAYRAKSEALEDSGERNLTESLVKRGIRSILAMSERIPDEVALTLTQLFYRNLSQGYPLDLCVSRVRQGLISAYGSEQMYWALPILYLQREFDGCLIPKVNLPGYMTTPSGLSELLNEYQPPKQTNSYNYSTGASNLEIPLAIDDILNPNLPEDSAGVDWLGEDTWGDLVDEIEYDNPSYHEDSAIVSDLFRQLGTPVNKTEEPSMKAELIPQEHHLSEMQVAQTKQNLDWGNVPSQITSTSSNIEKRQVNPQLSPSPVPPQGNRSRQTKSPLLLYGLVGASAISVIVGIGWWWHQKQAQKSTDVPQIPGQNSQNHQYPSINLANSATGIVTATAMAQLSQGNLKAGLDAINELLNRGAFASAETALNLIPAQDAENSSVNFFRGRLAWQSVQTKNNKYSIDDARRYWARAVQNQPDSLVYNNALGFAYYAENNLNYANDAWFKSLSLALKPQENKSSSPMKYPQIAGQPEALTAYAGLALGLYKSANTQPPDKRQQYLREAIKLRQMVIQNAPADFTIEKLSQNWLWTEQAIADWGALLQENSP